MAEIKLNAGEKEDIRQKLVDYCEANFDLRLEQFDADFFTDFVIEELGPALYNAGVEEAIKTHATYCERIQEEMDLKKIL
ncbi:DUF2164 domain-containing protein [Buttiauxella sp. S04-F03]|uniref:DUF2164 domain-containing protein n=1 Tax=Buttiauxella sp. S04-F03 TaxID=2904525 RepID=UPI0012ADABB1|nr:DUF2164 family protein [Buttiauxella sp. S04-F03]MCE0811418.1 DUF2164 domain-containing protein [Buttiauxella sp. S04-F03]MRT10918.1 DUF2164 family protein [Enterobacteriaceae bacterium RIT711]